MYSLKEKIVNQIQRHAIGIILILAGLLLLSMIGNVVMLKDFGSVAANGVLMVGLGTALILLVTHFAFPKLDIQERIKDDPTAIAIFAGLVAVAIALLF
jgi:uncharacterized membrane protein YjfL (UPF0719 family)